MPYIDGNYLNPEIHVGDYGTNFIVTIYDQDGVVFNVSSATSLAIRFLSPSGISTDKTATPLTDGIDGKIIYAVEDGLFDEAGEWKYQAKIVFAGGNWTTNRIKFSVYGNISAPVVP